MKQIGLLVLGLAATLVACANDDQIAVIDGSTGAGAGGARTSSSSSDATGGLGAAGVGTLPECAAPALDEVAIFDDGRSAQFVRMAPGPNGLAATWFNAGNGCDPAHIEPIDITLMLVSDSGPIDPKTRINATPEPQAFEAYSNIVWNDQGWLVVWEASNAAPKIPGIAAQVFDATGKTVGPRVMIFAEKYMHPRLFGLSRFGDSVLQTSVELISPERHFFSQPLSLDGKPTAQAAFDSTTIAGGGSYFTVGENKTGTVRIYNSGSDLKTITVEKTDDMGTQTGMYSYPIQGSDTMWARDVAMADDEGLLVESWSDLTPSERIVARRIAADGKPEMNETTLAIPQSMGASVVRMGGGYLVSYCALDSASLGTTIEKVPGTVKVSVLDIADLSVKQTIDIAKVPNCKSRTRIRVNESGRALVSWEDIIDVCHQSAPIGLARIACTFAPSKDPH